MPDARILIVDVECSPSLAFTWSLWPDAIGISQVVDSAELLCFAAKFYGENKMYYFSAIKDGKEQMILAAHKLFSEANVVVSYNGKRYDTLHFNREFLLMGLNPPSPYRQVDLYQVVKQRFKFLSNKLDFVALELGLGEKVHKGVDFSLWKGCMENDPKSWKLMEKYNKQDVRLTEKLFDRLLPWLGNIYNAGLYAGLDFCCPICGSQKLSKEGLYYKQSTAYQRYSCGDCGAWSHDKTTIVKTQLRPAVP